MKPKIEVGTYQTRNGRTATVTQVDEEAEEAAGTIDGIEYSWHLPNGNYFHAHDNGLDLVTRILEPTKPEQIPVETAKPSTFEVRQTQWTMTPSGKPIYDERSMTLKIEDEAGGEFLVLENCGDCGKDKGFRFDVEEWPTLRALIDEAVKGVRK